MSPRHDSLVPFPKPATQQCHYWPRPTTHCVSLSHSPYLQEDRPRRPWQQQANCNVTRNSCLACTPPYTSSPVEQVGRAYNTLASHLPPEDRYPPTSSVPCLGSCQHVPTTQGKGYMCSCLSHGNGILWLRSPMPRSQGVQPLSFTCSCHMAPIQQPALPPLFPPQTATPKREARRLHNHTSHSRLVSACRNQLLPPTRRTPQAAHPTPPQVAVRSLPCHYPPAEDTHSATLHSVFMSLSVTLQIAATKALNDPREILSS